MREAEHSFPVTLLDGRTLDVGALVTVLVETRDTYDDPTEPPERKAQWEGFSQGYETGIETTIYKMCGHDEHDRFVRHVAKMREMLGGTMETKA